MSPLPASLNASSKLFLSLLPKNVDYSNITIHDIRNNPSIPLCDAIPRPKVTVDKIEIPANDGHPIHVNVYRPASASVDEVLPVLVYLPGGGWNLPAQGGHPYLVTKLAGETHCTVLLVNYSLSPEVRFPVAVEECFSVVEWVSNPDHAKKLKVDATRVAVGGDSAGGNLTISTTLLAKQRNLKNKIKYQVLYYPATDSAGNSSSYQQFGENHFLTKGLTELFFNNYIRNEEDKKNMLACPVNTTIDDVTDLPPALLITGEADILRDEGEAYGRKLLDAGVPVTSFRVQGVLHGFMSVPPIIGQETLNVIDMTTGALRRVFATQ